MCLRDAIYPVPQGCACFMLILNILLPGSGTMLQSFFGGRKCPLTFFVGILQLLSVALLLFGWCWAIWHAEMVRCVSSPDHLGRPAPATEMEETDKVKDNEQAAAWECHTHTFQWVNIVYRYNETKRQNWSNYTFTKYSTSTIIVCTKVLLACSNRTTVCSFSLFKFHNEKMKCLLLYL